MKLNLRIDGELLHAKEGDTVLETARANDIFIPTLCYLPKLHSRSICRLCIVEIRGVRGMVPACTTPVTEGMEVTTTTPLVDEARKVIMEFTLLEHGDCGDPDCAIEALADRVGVETARRPPPRKPNPRTPLVSSEFLRVDLDKCVHCDRCIIACRDRAVIGRWGHGGDVSIAFDNDLSVIDSSCVQCGDCIEVCPAGVLERGGEL